MVYARMGWVFTIAAALLAAAVPAFAHDPGVSDGGGFFSGDAVKRADATIARIKQEYGKDVVIETFAEIPEAMRGDFQTQGKAAFYPEWIRNEGRGAPRERHPHPHHEEPRAPRGRRRQRHEQEGVHAGRPRCAARRHAPRVQGREVRRRPAQGRRLRLPADGAQPRPRRRLSSPRNASPSSPTPPDCPRRRRHRRRPPPRRKTARWATRRSRSVRATRTKRHTAGPRSTNRRPRRPRAPPAAATAPSARTTRGGFGFSTVMKSNAGKIWRIA